ncbi:P13 family porin [Treponema phagedenis]|nr:P13 family porin [Treponema phagedenis]NVP24658.1 P13 family porin [Treponema phagedenis]QKS92896.1 P13 family porin [Treponema phagedenis]QLC58853.1 P13 family porin [Treponema phagedenis]CEM60959.1 conserved exported hypothetical protein [Treponema phagedenis]
MGKLLIEKKLLFFCFMLITAEVLSAQSNFAKIQLLIDKGLHKNKAEIALLAADLTDQERVTLLNRNTLSLDIPMLLNGVIGFGSGSFVNKDYIAGGIHCGIDVACTITSITVGYLYSTRMMNSATSYDSDKMLKDTKIVLYTAITGFSVLAINKIAQLITLPVYTNKYNAALHDALLGQGVAAKKPVKIQLFPVFVPENIGLALAVDY